MERAGCVPVGHLAVMENAERAGVSDFRCSSGLWQPLVVSPLQKGSVNMKQASGIMTAVWVSFCSVPFDFKLLPYSRKDFRKYVEITE